MKITQIYEIMNNVTDEVLGTSELLKEDLSNIIDLGTEIISKANMDHYVKSLVNHIGKVVFVNRPYSGSAPSILMDGWEYGSILQKITMDELPKATENSSWSLEDGKTYDQFVFHQPKVSSKFFNDRVTFEIEMSFTTKQIKQSFDNATQLNAFISMIETAIEKSMTVKIDSLIQRTINNLISETIYSEYTTKKSYGQKSGVRAVNLLYLYNKQANSPISASECLTNSDFIKFATFKINQYIDRLGKLSTLFNVGGKDRFTSKDLLHVIMLSDFKSSSNIYLQSETYHNELTALPNCETVPFWQSSGTEYDFDTISSINIKNGNGHDVNISGILAVMFDRDACGVTNMDRRVTSSYNAKGEYFNNFYKMDCGSFNDLNENAVVFFISDSSNIAS